jgi:pimeloyl-ACP methyl ester carboxylesterase
VRSSELASLGRLGGDALARPAAAIGDVHRAVAGRVFGALGLLGAPVRLMHDGISAAAYGGVRGAMRLVPRATAAPLVRALPASTRAMADSRAGSLALAALNGAWGDTISRTHPELALELTVRRGGRAVVLDSEGLASSFPDASPRVAVFLHGLCETEAAWRLGDRPPYGTLLRDELGYTPIEVRYNTGLRVSDNGRRLSEVLENLVKAWPVEIGEIALVGHSMGGLVARSACHYGAADERDWTHGVRHVFCLGTPHLGAPMEKAANVAGWALTRLPETRPFGELVNLRSAGIKDMRFGSCVEPDWCDCDPDEYLRDRCTEVPFLDAATYYFIGATLSRRADDPLGRVVGDLLVNFPSASGSGRRRRIPFEIDNGRHLGGLTHFALLNHPAVYEQIRDWLRRAPAELPAGPR